MDPQRQWEIEQQLAATTEGVCVSIDWASGLAVVNQNGVTVAMPWKGDAPWPDGRVRIDVAGKQRVCQPIHGAPIGVVVSVASDLVTVTGDDDVTYVYPHLGAAPTSGQRVHLMHAARAVASGVYSTEPPGSEFEPGALPPPPPAVSESAWFSAVWSGNYYYGSPSTEFVEVSVSRTAAYGYGQSIADTIPPGAAITKAELHLVQLWDNLPGVNSSMGTHSFDGKPGSFDNDDITGSVSVPGGSRVVDIRGTIADALAAGTAFGVGFRAGSNGWRRYDKAPNGGRIYMEWRVS